MNSPIKYQLLYCIDRRGTREWHRHPGGRFELSDATPIARGFAALSKSGRGVDGTGGRIIPDFVIVPDTYCETVHNALKRAVRFE